MRKLIFMSWIFFLFASVTWAQEKVDAPIWNVGDKWTFTGNGIIEVIKADQSGYILKFSDETCIIETQTCNAILFEKTTRNRINAVEGDKRKKYTMGFRRILDFPFSTGKQWKDAYTTKSFLGPSPGRFSLDYAENFSALGWEDIEVRAGKFKALKLEYKRILKGSSSAFGGGNIGEENKSHYWYSPDAKYFVKCQYDKDWMKGYKEIFDWELTSFQMKK